jgi:autotransporter passenger strand-loop-strand repeat protein
VWGGVASGTVLSSGGIEDVELGGVAIGTVVSSGGGEWVFSGGVAIGTVVSSGGGEYVFSGGVAIGTVVSSGGIELVSSDGGVASAVNLLSGGLLDERAFAYASGGTTSFNSSTDTLTIAQGGRTYTQTFSGDYTGETFSLSADGYGGTNIAITNVDSSFVSSGVTSTGRVISGDGHSLTVLNGGVASGTIVVSGGAEVISFGGVARGTVLSDGGNEYVSSGGVTRGTVVSGGGNEVVYAGGVTSGTVVSRGGTEVVYGVARGTTVRSDGAVVVSAGGVVSGAVLSGFLDAYQGMHYGALYVTSGGVTRGTVVSGGGEEVVSNGGVAIGTLLSAGSTDGHAVQYVFSGGVTRGTVLDSGRSREFVCSGGVASGTVVKYENTLEVSAGGVASGAVLNVGNEFVWGGGVAIGTVASGIYLYSGNVFVFSGGVTSGTVLNYNGAEYVESGGVTSGTVVSSGGTENVFSGGVASAVNLLSGGLLDEWSLTYVDGGTTSFDSSTDILTISEGGHTYIQTFSGDYTGETFSLSADIFGGTLVSVAKAKTPAVTVAQFLSHQATLDQNASGFIVTDNAANVLASFDALNADTHLAAITFTDAGTPTLTLSATQALGDTAAIGKIGGPYALAILDTAANISANLDGLSVDAQIGAITISDNKAVGANVAQLTTDATTIAELLNADGSPFHLAVSDTANNIQNGLATLVADTSHISSITATGGLARFSTALFAADKTTLDKIVGGFGITDSAAKVSGSLDALQGDVADIASIKFSDASPPTLNITSAQLTADAAALAKIVSPYILDVANAGGASSYVGYGNGLVFNIGGGGSTSTIKGGGLNESFVFAAGFKTATISEFATHGGVASNDTISLAKSDFANWATLLSDAHTGAGGSISFVSQTSGATLTLAGVSVAAFEKVGAPYQSEFTFHA